MATLNGSTATPKSCPVLAARYRSPTNESFSFEEKLPTLTTTLLEDRVAYLSQLRESTAQLQGIINAELTKRMTEDKLLEEKNAAQDAVDDAREEENYGEEVVEEDN
ncbi:MAG: hypothetical protein M1818_005828 [Claussenomyces sp. TS43310]|nr:MAG: hypothetical protein M1818_005828 [Claussenomyces sp. TS43310]